MQNSFDFPQFILDLIDYEGLPHINVGDILDDSKIKLTELPNNFIEFKNRSQEFENNHSQYQDRINLFILSSFHLNFYILRT